MKEYILPDGYRLTVPQSLDDEEKLCTFNSSIHGPRHDELTREMMHHPESRPEYWMYIEDGNGKIVSALGLQSETWSYCGVVLKCAEMTLVGTLPELRGLGLSGCLIQHFQGSAAENNFDIEGIQGIPYFYIQFGYEYSFPLENHFELLLHQISVVSEDLTIRPAGPDDIELLEKLYRQSMQTLDIHTVRTKEVWEYLTGPSLKTLTAVDRFIVLSNGCPEGYFGIAREGFGRGLILQEFSDMTYDSAFAVFGFLKKKAVDLNKTYIRLNLSRMNTAVKAVLNPSDMRGQNYAWQIRVTDWVKFFGKIKHLLEERLSESVFRGYSGYFNLNCYRDGIRLKLESGKVGKIDLYQPEAYDPMKSNGDEICLPPNLLIPLLFGGKSFSELVVQNFTVRANQKSSVLAEVLFPKLEGYSHLVY